MRLTPEQVAERFEECVSTLDKLPSECRLGYTQYWPPIRYDPNELAQQSPSPIRLKATPDQITRMEETLTWVHWVNHGERNLLWLRAYGVSWRGIARRTGFPKSSAQRYWRMALEKIARRY